MEMAKYIMSIFKTQLMIVWSWGFHNPTAIENGMRFRVQGFKFKGIVEVAATTAGELDLYRTPGSEKVTNELRIVEIEFLHQIEKEGTK